MSLVSRNHRLIERAKHSLRDKEWDEQSCLAEELKAASGQCMSPSLDIDGTMLADATVEDVAKILEERGIII